MDFLLSEEQSALRDAVRRYCREHYNFQQRQRHLRSPIGSASPHWASFATLGWLGAALPEDVGGYGGSAIEMALILEEFGRSLVIEPYLFSVVLAAQAVCASADLNQRRALLEPMVLGSSVLALAHQECASTHGRPLIATTVRSLHNGGFILRGQKLRVLGGDQANLLIVSGRTSGDRDDPQGVSLFVVDQASTGISRRTYRTLDGRGAADFSFEGVHLPRDALLGAEDSGLAAVERATDWAIVGLCAEALGSMGSVLSATIAFLRARRAYGSNLSEFQALQHRVADMVVELEMSRSIVHFALAAFAHGAPDCMRKAASSAKAIVGRASLFIAANGVQLHGASGLLEDDLIGQQFKRLTVAEALFGNPEFHLMRRSRRLESQSPVRSYLHAQDSSASKTA